MTNHIAPDTDPGTSHVGPYRACPSLVCRTALAAFRSTHSVGVIEHLGSVLTCELCTDKRSVRAADETGKQWHAVPDEQGAYHRGVRAACTREPCATYRESVKRDDEGLRPTQTYAEFLKMPTVATPEMAANRELVNTAIRKQMGDTEQPLPTGNDMQGCHDRVIDFVASRRDVGIERYGMPLQPMNGRDFARDLREELADALCYLDGLDRNRKAGLRGLSRIADLIESAYKGSVDTDQYAEYVREIDAVRTAFGAGAQ